MCLIDEQGLISAQGGIYQKINKRTGPNHYYTVVPNKSAQGGFFFKKKNKRTCSCIRHSRVFALKKMLHSYKKLVGLH